MAKINLTELANEISLESEVILSREDREGLFVSGDLEDLVITHAEIIEGMLIFQTENNNKYSIEKDQGLRAISINRLFTNDPDDVEYGKSTYATKKLYRFLKGLRDEKGRKMDL